MLCIICVERELCHLQSPAQHKDQSPNMAPKIKKSKSTLSSVVEMQNSQKKATSGQSKTLDSSSTANVTEAGDDTEPPVYFWQTTGHFGCLIQWYQSEFTVSFSHFSYLVDNNTNHLEKIKDINENIRFCTAEQYMMFGIAIFFRDFTTAADILETDDPRLQKALGRTVQDFDEDAWKTMRSTIVEKANVEKFKQNDEARAILLDTGNRLLVEASPRDKIWGIGLGADRAEKKPRHLWGLNLLGKALIIARAKLRAECSRRVVCCYSNNIATRV